MNSLRTICGLVRPKRRTLRATILRAAVLPLLWFATGVGAYAATSVVLPAPAVERDERAPHVPGEDRLRSMLSAGVCWGNDGKPHPYPTHVWVTVPWGGSGDVRYELRGQRAVDRALASGDYSRVAVFCRLSAD